MRKLILCCWVTVFVFILAGCGPLNAINPLPGDDMREEIIIEKDESQHLDVNVQFKYGDLTVTGGSSEWVTGELHYTNDRIRIDSDYTTQRENGAFTIEQKSKRKINAIFGNQRNSWDLQLSNDVPIDLIVDAGVSDTALDLRGLHLTGLVVDAGVGSVNIDLSGDWHESFEATIDTGVGETTIFLPNDVGVKVIAKTGIGNTSFKGLISQGKNVYVNEAYETSDVVIQIVAETGIGETVFILK
ncbi:toast rack family protein [Evansella cellulosilytica]|uniref:DUF2154 domain-containing protein n=1 Tax=Evansella cellulosilytica (strain ATCC 21833 / DSM 2522 / FERM P-1141 / JCM 9156 / N-4) TaxID=649639 RepID=E6TTY0_EVAC2|nr:toast rack family protein [Evansella cellulosilytica]ADU32011.1 hypothetical protein Bcell_3771 [Evansella cellulosilytica DSM 2522]